MKGGRVCVRIAASYDIYTPFRAGLLLIAKEEDVPWHFIN